MEKLKKGCLFIVCCLLAVALPAQTLSEQDIIKKMAFAAEKTKTVRADFTQTKYSKMLRDAQTSQGKLFCELPDKLRWEYTSPRQSAIVLDGTKAGFVKGSKSQGARGKEQGARSKLAGETARMIMNCVAGKCLTDSKAFQVSAKASANEYEATLLPLGKEMKRMYAKLVLHFDVKQEAVTAVELYEKNGDRTVIKLHDIRINN